MTHYDLYKLASKELIPFSGLIGYARRMRDLKESTTLSIRSEEGINNRKVCLILYNLTALSGVAVGLEKLIS